MKVTSQQIRLSATDLSNHLACRHLTTLDLQVALGKRTEPDWAAPDLAVIIERGERHEREYLAHLCAQGLTVENLSRIPHKEEERLLAETLALMERGAEVIAQGALSDGEWFGRPDVLRRVAISSRVWEWSYEVADTKLARETRAATILQLSLYSDLLGENSGDNAGIFVGGAAGGRLCGRKISRVGVRGVFYRYVRERLRKANNCGEQEFKGVCHVGLLLQFPCGTQRRNLLKSRTTRILARDRAWRKPVTTNSSPSCKFIKPSAAAGSSNSSTASLFTI